IVYDDGSLRDYFERAARVAPEHPVLIDRFLEDAFEADVDAIADGRRSVIGGVMQHIEDAGVHSGDSACVLPPYLIGDRQVEEMRRHTKAFAEALGVVGLINVQYAIQAGVVHVLEVNPRASRTVPFVSKATGLPLAKLAAAVMAGRTRDDRGLPDDVTLTGVSIVRRFHELGFQILATEGTERYLRARGIPAERVAKVHEGRPNAIDLIVSGEIHLLINTPLGKFTQADDYAIRRTALVHR